MKTTRLLAVLTPLVLACGLVTDSGHSHGECFASYDSFWSSHVRYQLNHDDFRTCPYTSSYHEYTQSGGIVYDLTANFPNAGATDQLYVQAFDNNSNSNDPTTCMWPLSEEVLDPFDWGQSRPESTEQYEWQAEGWVGWIAGFSPDYVCFKASLIGTSGVAHAAIELWWQGPE